MMKEQQILKIGVDNHYHIFIEKSFDPCYQDDFESEEFFDIALVHTSTGNTIGTISTGGVGITELNDNISDLIGKQLKQ